MRLRRGDAGRIGLVIAIVTIVALVFAFDLDRFFGIAAIKDLRETLRAQWLADPVPTVAAFMALNIVALALSLPGAVLTFSLAAGAIFGLWPGAAIALLAIVAGDSLAFLLARYALRGWIERRFPRPAARVNRGVCRDGWLYLLSLRLLAVMPYFLVNWTMGLTRLPLKVFAPVSFIGLIPATILYVEAGSEIATIDSASDIYSPKLLIIFALMALLPLAARTALRWWRGRAAVDAELI